MVILHKKAEELPPLLDMLLREIIHYPKSHLTGLRRPEQLDGGAVKFRAQPLLRIQPDTFRFLLFLHDITPE